MKVFDRRDLTRQSADQPELEKSGINTTIALARTVLARSRRFIEVSQSLGYAVLTAVCDGALGSNRALG